MKKTQIKYLDNEMIIEDSHCIFSLQYDTIAYIQYQKPYIIISLFSGKEYFVYNSLSHFENHLPLAFFACNQSIIVNLKYVQLIKREGPKLLVCVKDGRKIYVSRRNQKIIMKRYYLIKSTSFKCDKCLFCNQHDFNKSTPNIAPH